MNMKHAAFAAIVSIVSTALPFGAAQAGLIGQTVTGNYYFPDLGTIALPGGAQLVSPTATYVFGTGVPNVTAIVSDTDIRLNFDASGSFNPATFSGPVFTFGTPDIINVILSGLSNVPGFTAADISFSNNTIALNLQNVAIPDGSDFIDIVITTSAAAVPEPSTLALFGAGLLAVMGFGWRRKVRS
jgi:hypothetical protein